jgi:hypothetical protein
MAVDRGFIAVDNEVFPLTRPHTTRLSYHDPDGSVYLSRGQIWRTLHRSAAQRIDKFLASDLAVSLTERRGIPATERAAIGPIDYAGSNETDEVWYKHRRIPFINYPHEWIPEQFVAACVFTLDLACELRAAGWDVKDGNARNVIFDGSNPVFVDFGSFVERNDRDPVWRPSGQIHRQFLVPLLLYLHLGLPPSVLLLGRPDGLSSDEAYKSLGSVRWLDGRVFRLVTLPTLLSRRRSVVELLKGSYVDPGIAKVAVDRTISALSQHCKTISRDLPDPNSNWASYEQSRTHYSEGHLQRKRSVIVEMLNRLRPKDVLDVGTNGGEFANIAATSGSRVVSIDTDLEALRSAYTSAADKGLQILHLNVDFAASSPAMGWGGSECLSFDQRAEQAFDMVLFLAVLHHVLVAGRIPLSEILAKVASYTRSHLIIEYVDPSDKMFSALAIERQIDFSFFSREMFIKELTRHFDILEAEEIIPARRTLYLCVKKSTGLNT